MQSQLWVGRAENRAKILPWEAPWKSIRSCHIIFYEDWVRIPRGSTEEGYTRYCPRHAEPQHHWYAARQGRRVTGAADSLCFYKAFCSPHGKPWRFRSHKTPWVTKNALMWIPHAVLSSCTWNLCRLQANGQEFLWQAVKYSRLDPLTNRSSHNNLEPALDVHLRYGPWKVCKNKLFWDSSLIKSDWACEQF